MDNKERKFLILGSPVSKANSRRIVSFGGKIRSIKSQKGLEYETSCITQLKKQNGSKTPLRGSVGVEITIWYQSRRNDLDPSIILDCMQKALVYENDRQIIQMTLFKELDKESPRSEILVYELGN